MEELIHELNEAWQKEKNELVLNNDVPRVYSLSRDRITAGMESPMFSYKPTARRVFITVPGRTSLTFPPMLESILGLSPLQNPLSNDDSRENVI